MVFVLYKTKDGTKKDDCGLKKWISLNYYQSFPLSVRFYVPNNRSQRILKLMVFCQLQNNLFSNWLGKWFSEYSYASIELPILLYLYKYIHVCILRCFLAFVMFLYYIKLYQFSVNVALKCLNISSNNKNHIIL